MLNFHHLRYFWAVAHDGNLTRTAERLNVSQSALSVQIKTLEDRLGHKLFDRRGRALVLTEAGRVALAHADAIFAEGEMLVSTLADRRGDDGDLRIGARATLSRNFQLAFLKPALDHEGTRIVLRAGRGDELIADLVDLKLDMVLTNRLPESDVEGLLVQPIADQAVSLVGTPERVGLSPDPETLLTTHPVIVPSRESGIRPEFDALMERWGLAPEIAAEVDDMAMMRLLAREDIGLAVLPPIVVRDELEAARLVDVGTLPDTHETFYAVTAKRRFPHPLARTLIDRFMEKSTGV